MLRQAALARDAAAGEALPAKTMSSKSVMTPAELRDALCTNPSGPAARCYRTWVKQVLLPLSERASKLVVERADLLEGSSIEQLLLQLVAHTSALKVLVHRWEQAGSEHEHGELQTSPIAYPDQLQRWVEEGFKELKKRQAELLGIGDDGQQGSPLMRLITSRL